MGQRVIRNHQDLIRYEKYLETRQFPFTVSDSQGAKRSAEQNRLMRQWCLDLEAQGDQTAEEYRAEIKLRLGVPILRAENADFCARYDEVVKPLPYETKLELMREPFDFPVTRLMTVKQQNRLLDEVQRHYSAQGFHLTDPEAPLWEARMAS